jgi:hypothetical protein
MNPQVFGLVLIACLGLYLVVAASRGCTMPVSVCLALIIIGAVMALAPVTFSFFLQLAGRQPQFTDDERITCWVLGGALAMTGLVGSVLSRRKITGCGGGTGAGPARPPGS